MRKYWAFYILGLQNAFAYRGPMLFWLIGNIISMFVMITVWFSVSAGSKIAGYSRNELLTYYVVSLALQWIVGWYPFNWIRESIKDGGIIGDALVKPIAYIFRAFAAESSWHSISILPGFFASLVFYLVFRANFVNYFSLNLMPILILTIVTAILTTFLFSLCLGLVTFWIIETEMLADIFFATLAFFGGQVLPISFLPVGLQTFLRILPFRYMFSFPLEVYFHKLNNAEIGFGLVVEFFWIIILVAVYKFLWSRGVRKYDAFGQ